MHKVFKGIVAGILLLFLATLPTIAAEITNAGIIDENYHASSAFYFSGNCAYLDADNDTAICADTDDQIDVQINGVDDFQFTANTFTSLAGSSIVSGASSWLGTVLDGFSSITATTFTDGTFSATGGAFTGLVSLTDSVASWASNALSGFTSISGTTLTDGTASISGGIGSGFSSITSTAFVGDLTGNADTASALAANGGNCSSGNSPLGVDESGAVESCFDVWTEAENTAAGYITASSTDTLTNKTIDANGTGNSISNLETADFAANVVDTDTTLAANSDTRLASQKAIKSFVAATVASSVNYQGGYNAATNTPDLDTAPSGVSKGDMYAVTDAGTFFTTAVEVGDVLISEVDDADAESEWTIVNKNLDAASIKTAYESNADTNALTDAWATILGNTSNTNSGDQTSIVGISGTTAEFNTALSDGSFATGGGTATGSNTGDNAANSSSTYIGTTAVALNRASAALSLTGVNIDGSAGSATTATTATNLAAGSGGTIPYQSAAGTTAMLANGAAGKFLQANGTTLAPSWETVSVGDVSKVNTPLDNQIGVWTGDGTIEGTTNFTFNSATKVFQIGVGGDDAASTLSLFDGHGNYHTDFIQTVAALNIQPKDSAATVVVNDDGATAVDFRIESDGDANLFLTDGAIDVIGIGTDDFDGTPAIGKLIVKGSTNDGTTNIFVGRDSDEANVFSIDTNGLATGSFSGSLTGTASAVTGFTPASGSLTLAGADAVTITTTGATGITLPTSGTLITNAVSTLSSLTSVGTIGTGTWEATDVGVAHGGTGKSSWTQWLIPYASSTTAFSQIAIGTDGQVLTSAGAGAAPAFETLSIGVANLANGTDGELITWNASGVAATIGVGTAAQVLTSNGAGAAPTFQDASGGGGVLTVTTKTDDYQLTSDDYGTVLLMNADSKTFTLPDASTGEKVMLALTGQYASQLTVNHGTDDLYYNGASRTNLYICGEAKTITLIAVSDSKWLVFGISNSPLTSSCPI